eukprot:1340059-Rhodomonas_salina.1
MDNANHRPQTTDHRPQTTDHRPHTKEEEATRRAARNEETEGRRGARGGQDTCQARDVTTAEKVNGRKRAGRWLKAPRGKGAGGWERRRGRRA